MAGHTIGQAAKAAGVTPRAIRLYESRGLLRSPQRTAAGYRMLTDDDVDVLAFIRRGRRLGLSLDAIAEIMKMADNGEPCCDRTQALLAQRLAEVDTALAELQRLRATIAQAQRVQKGQRAGSRCIVVDAIAEGDGAPAYPCSP